MNTRGLFVAGTDTEVGKTFVTCQMIRQLRHAGIPTLGMKPVASGMQLIDGEWRNQDIDEIQQACNGEVAPELLNQYAYEPFIAPHLAAAQLGESISLDVIGRAYRELVGRCRFVVVEGAGGLMTPLNADQTFADLAIGLELPVVLVVAIRLGCINHALLSQQVMQSMNIRFVGWVANYPEAGEPDEGIENSLVSRLDAPLLGVIPFDPSGNHVQELDSGWSEAFF